ncbi:hypothetical protein AAFN88_12900 [Pelagibius sp. CAU 1746]|uniref:hypothetical protein n=1 Tax=Pelagibius sp. CAU 1746 TaxID=3140370 RepID=UPI00325BBFCC
MATCFKVSDAVFVGQAQPDLVRPLQQALTAEAVDLEGRLVTMTAGFTALKYFQEDEVRSLNALGDYARSGLTKLFRTLDIPACVTGSASLFRIHLKPTPPGNFRQTFQTAKEKAAIGTMVARLYDEGIMVIYTGSAALSTPMSRNEVDVLIDACSRVLKAMRPQLDNLA